MQYIPNQTYYSIQVYKYKTVNYWDRYNCHLLGVWRWHYSLQQKFVCLAQDESQSAFLSLQYCSLPQQHQTPLSLCSLHDRSEGGQLGGAASILMSLISFFKPINLKMTILVMISMQNDANWKKKVYDTNLHSWQERNMKKLIQKTIMCTLRSLPIVHLGKKYTWTIVYTILIFILAFRRVTLLFI